MTHINEEGDAYKKFFSAALKKYGVKSPHELDNEKKKSFFNYIEKNYKAKDETAIAESDFSAKIDAYQSAMNALDSYVETLNKLGIKKKAKLAEKALKMIQKSFFAKENLGEQQKLMDEDPEKFEVMKQFVDKAFKKAGIKVKKTKIMKRGFTRSVFGMFYYVKAASGNDVLPVYIDKKGMMELGVSSWGFKLGKLDQFNKIVANLKDFKKSDLDEAMSEGKLRSRIKKAILIAIEMSGNMTGAVDKIEKIKKGLSNDDKVAAALRMANESKLTEVGSPLNSYVSHALQDMTHLLDVAQDKEHGPDAYQSVKKSAKLLIAAIKLLRKVK